MGISSLVPEFRGKIAQTGAASRLLAWQTVRLVYYSCFQFRSSLTGNALALLRLSVGSTFHSEVSLTTL